MNRVMFLPRSGWVILAVYFSARWACHQRWFVALATSESLKDRGSIVADATGWCGNLFFPALKNRAKLMRRSAADLCTGFD
jgi:hypothetical protein